MYQFILNQIKNKEIEPFNSESFWYGPLKGFIDKSIKVLESNKILIITYKAFPPPFQNEVFKKYIEIMRTNFQSFNLLFPNNTDTCRIYFESFINYKLSGVLICSEDTWKALSEENWFPLINDLYIHVSTIDQLNIEIESFLGDFEALTFAGYQVLSPTLKQTISKFDLSQLFFFPFMVKYCTSLKVKLNTHNLETITSFLNSFVNFENYSFPTFEVISKMNSNKECSILIQKPLKINKDSLNMLQYQNLITDEDYLNLKILSFLSTYASKIIYSDKSALILSKNFYEKLKLISDLIFEPLGKKVAWFISRLYIESYFALGAPPQINDHQLSFNLWPIFPENASSVIEFENLTIKISKRLDVETTRKDLGKLGEKIWNKKIPPVFFASYLLKVGISDQREFLKTVVNEIAVNIIKRWEENSFDETRIRNGQVLLKISEILSILHILNDLADFDQIKIELNNPQLVLYTKLLQILSSSKGEMVSSKQSNLFNSFAQDLVNIYPIWVEVSINSSNLVEASSSYEKIKNFSGDHDGISSFCYTWAQNLRTDVDKERRGEILNSKKWDILSKKYDEITHQLISAIINDNTNQFVRLNQTWKEAQKYLSQMDTVFIIIADSMSLVDWYTIKDHINLDGFKINENFAISTIPTETPVGHASLFSGLQPAECGVTGRTFLDKKGTPYELAHMQEESEDDVLIKTVDYKYQSMHLRSILSSDNFEKKAIVISPFKGTRLTQTLKALISDQSEFIDLEYKEDQQFEATTKNIGQKIASFDRKKLTNKIVIIQYPNIDSRGHTGEWNEHIYFEMMEQEVNKLLHDIYATSKKENIHCGIIITSDHGKLLRWEINKIMSAINNKDETINFNKVASIVLEELNNFSKFSSPVKSAKYIMGWMNEDVSRISTILTSKIAEKTQIFLPSATDIQLFTGDDIFSILGKKKNDKILYPNFLMISLYQFGGGGKMQHSGLSLGELIIPFVFLEVEKS